MTHGDAPWGRLALAGALLHVWNHGAFKSLLFFGAGSVLHATGTREMSRLGGLWRAMPWTAGLFALGSVAVSGLPPLNGFVSEWLVYLGLFDAVTSKGPSAWAAMPAAIMLAMAGAVAMASFAKAGAMIFLGAPRTQAAAQAHECGNWMRGPMLALAGVCVMIGLAPILFWPAVARAVGAWHPAWASAEAPAPLFTLGSVHVALAILVLAAAVVAVAEGAREWPASRPDVGLRLRDAGRADAIHQRLVRRNRRRLVCAGCCDRSAKCADRAATFRRRPSAWSAFRKPCWSASSAPVGAAIMRVSTAVRRLQHGRLQFYILYVVAGLMALGVLVLLGGAQ